MRFLNSPELSEDPGKRLLWLTKLQALVARPFFPEYSDLSPEEIADRAILPNRFYRSRESYAPFCSPDFRIETEYRFNVRHREPLFEAPGSIKPEPDEKLTRVVLLEARIPGAKGLSQKLFRQCRKVHVDLMQDLVLFEEADRAVRFHGSVLIWAFHDADRSAQNTAEGDRAIMPRTFPESLSGVPLYMQTQYMFLGSSAGLR